MSGIDDLIGSGGVIEQMLLWGVVNQVVTALASPAFQVLQQDVAAAHPEVLLDPATLATAVARNLMDGAAAEADAGRSGTSVSRFELLRAMATVRLAPADLATAVLRSYMTAEDAQEQATPQGYDASQMATLVNLQGDAPGPQQVAEALRRGIITHDGTGPDSTSFMQGIAESRLHDKWAPMIEALSEVPLSPADAADAVIRNFLSNADGVKVAGQQGVDAGTFATMTHLAGDAPGPQQLAEALRRGAIGDEGTGADSTSFTQGIAEGRLADKWAPVIKSLAQLWPTPVDALNATLKGQVTQDEGLALYEKLGGDPQFFQVLFDTQGEAPTPLELIEMANRGYIPWDGTGPDVVSYAQGFKEGRWRDKWQSVYQKFSAYVPPPSTVVQFTEQSLISSDKADQYLTMAGMDDTLKEAYIASARLSSLSEYRGLSAGVAINAYRALIITADQLKKVLTSLHVTTEAADVLISYADARRELDQLNSAVGRIRSLYTTRKIPLGTARDALTTLGIPAAQIPKMIDIWSLEFSVAVKTLSGEQIALAFTYGGFTQDEAVHELVNIGYTPVDGWAMLVAYSKKLLPDKPEPGPPPALGSVTPGLT